MSYRRLLVLALIAGLPGIASAQFTTFIPPKAKTADSVKAVVVAAQQAVQDSVTNLQITNMKTWVDSAAGTATVPPMTAADSLATSAASTTPAPVAAAATDTMAMRNGARAPATASNLPLFVLLGLSALTIGGLLLLRPRPARART